MIKVLLVDDDFLVRMFLKQLNGWERAGFEIVGDACNGAEALDLAEQYRPEMIITDLCMPVMSGIELIRQVRDKMPETKILVLSCHDEFEYVKEAMQLGADEYMLKNLLDENTLFKQLEAMKERIEETTVQAMEQKKLQRLASKGVELLRQELVERLQQGRFSPEEQRSLLKEAGLKGHYETCAVVLVRDQRARGKTLPEVCQQFCRGQLAEAMEWLPAGSMAILDLSWVESELQSIERLRQFTQSLQHCIEEYLNIVPDIGVSGVCRGPLAVSEGFIQAERMVQKCFYEPGIHYFQAEEKMSTLWPDLAKRYLSLFSKRVAEGRIGEIISGGDLALEAFQNEGTEPKAVIRWLMRLDVEGGFEVQEDPPSKLVDCRERIRGYAEAVKQRHALREEAGGNRTIEQAIEYIRQHYAESISLGQVAEAVHLNSAYLSHLFKQETDVNYSDYLLHYRMEKARALIHQSEQPLKKVAEQVGFSDYRHFCKLFKKETGLRPAEYRKQKI